MNRLSIFLIAWLVFSASAAETISLKAYLEQANEEGHNIIFSSALVRSYYKVTYETSTASSLDEIRRTLQRFDLALAVEEHSHVVVKIPATDIPSSTDIPTSDLYLIEEIVVAASLHEFTMSNIGQQTIFDKEDLTKRPLIANDALRISARMPGAANNGVSSRSAIRGGLENETLINFNGMRLYEPFHLNHFNQLFSVVDGRIVDQVNIITGGFPAVYGDRLSGVMDIKSLNPASTESIREAGLGLYNASYLQTGGDSQDHYVFNIRRSTIDLLGALAESDLGTPSFADLFFNFERALSSSRSLSANLLWFGDDVKINNSSGTESADAIYGNTYLWFTLATEHSEMRSSESRVSFTAIKDDRDGSVIKPGLVSGQLIEDKEFRVYALEHKENITFNRSLMTLGATYRYLAAEYGSQSTLDINPRYSHFSNFPRAASQQTDITEYGQQIALYASIKHRFSNHWFAELGIRVDAQDYITSDFTDQVMPRLSLLYLVPNAGELRWSWGEFSQSQGIHELDIADGITSFQRPQKSKHLVLSYKQNFQYLDIRIEAYRKDAEETNFYFENLTDPLSLLPELQVDRTRIDPAAVLARGIEVSLATQLGANELWLNYTRAEVKEKVNGDSFRRSSDQKHAVNLGWARQWGGWQFALESTYHTGWPTTHLPELNDGRLNDDTLIRNHRRLSSYLSVDVKISKIWKLGNHQLRLESGITNILDRDNQLGTSYDLVDDKLIPTDRYSLPLAPFIDVYFSF